MFQATKATPKRWLEIALVAAGFLATTAPLVRGAAAAGRARLGVTLFWNGPKGRPSSLVTTQLTKSRHA